MNSTVASFLYTIKFRPGRDNVAADAFTREVCASINTFTLKKLP